MKPSPRKKSAAELEAGVSFANSPNRGRMDYGAEAVSAEHLPKIKKPKFLKGVAAKLWNEHSPNADLRTGFEAESFATWCVLQAEFLKNSARMQTSRLNIKRAYEERFGLNRTRPAKNPLLRWWA